MDLTQFRLDQSFTAAGSTRKILGTVPVRRPSREAFIRTHPSDEYRLRAAVVEIKAAGENYLVTRPMLEHLTNETACVPKVLITAITRQGTLFLWPIRLPGPDGRVDDWNRSALDAADHARLVWVRIQADRELGAYSLLEAPYQDYKPQWPAASFQEILNIAFKGRVIDTPDHPVLRLLRGEA